MRSGIIVAKQGHITWKNNMACTSCVVRISDQVHKAKMRWSQGDEFDHVCLYVGGSRGFHVAQMDHSYHIVVGWWKTVTLCCTHFTYQYGGRKERRRSKCSATPISDHSSRIASPLTRTRKCIKAGSSSVALLRIFCTPVLLFLNHRTTSLFVYS